MMSKYRRHGVRFFDTQTVKSLLLLWKLLLSQLKYFF